VTNDVEFIQVEIIFVFLRTTAEIFQSRHCSVGSTLVFGWFYEQILVANMSV